MDRWSGVLRVPLDPSSGNHLRIAASLCLSPSSKTLTVPSANAIFFNGDRVEGTGNPVIEKLSDTRNIAEILVSKLGGSVNAWVVEAATFEGPFAVYKEFVPSVNSWGEPKCYSHNGFPASASTVSFLSKCLEEIKNMVPEKQKTPPLGLSASNPCLPKTFIFGFSKGGIVLNQLVTELARSEVKPTGSLSHKEQNQACIVFHENLEENQIIPTSKDSLLSSISEIHYVDVGVNSSGAYLTDDAVIEKISRRLEQGATGIRFGLHGTPRQWCDKRRPWIRSEKDRLLQLLEQATQRSGGKLQVCERFYFADRPPSLQMHFEIIERLDIS